MDIKDEDTYQVVPKNKCRVGHIYFHFDLEVNKNYNCIILELKVDNSAEHTVQQIK